MAIFEKRRKISRRAFRKYLKEKAPSRYSGNKEKLVLSERMRMEKIFGKKYGNWITKKEFEKRIRDLEEEKRRSVAQRKSSAKLRGLKRQIKYLKRIGGTGN